MCGVETDNNDETNGCIFQWTIGNLTYWESEPKERGDSPRFIMNALKRAKWNVSMQLLPGKGLQLSLHGDWVGVADETHLNCEFAVLEKDGSIFKQVTEEDFDSFECTIEFCDHSKDFISERVFSKGTLKIQCTLWLMDEKLVNPQYIHARTVSLNGTFKHDSLATGSISSSLSEVALENRCQLSNDLKYMFQEEIFSDVKLQTSVKTFPAHKNILSARSSVFKQMFYSDKKEKSSGLVTIIDLDDDTVHRMLLYIYTDVLDDLPVENACKLYKASDKYEILSLRSSCSSILITNLSPTNVTDILCLADQHQDDELKSCVQNYILKHDKEVFCSPEWREFKVTNCKLAADMMYWFTLRKVGSEGLVCGNRFSTFKKKLQATESISSNQSEVALEKRFQLSNDLKCMFKEKIFSDVKLQASKKTFAAHKNILSARSPVFKRMFYSDMKEKNRGLIKITDLDHNTVHRMLMYIYTNALDDLSFENACKLYKASDKYEILSLKNSCSSILITYLSSTNVTDILSLADQHQDDKLKSYVQNFILNHDETVFCSQEWGDFMVTNCKLAADMMYRFTLRKVGSKRFVSGNRFSPY